MPEPIRQFADFKVQNPYYITVNDQVRKNLQENNYFFHKWKKKNLRYTVKDLEVPFSLYSTSPFMFADQRQRVGFGGTRSPTVDTFDCVFSIATALASANKTIVSGGVPGVDLAAHLGALESGIGCERTIAILANPVNFGLLGHELPSNFISKTIFQFGAFVSEYKELIHQENMEYKTRLLQRDRIISCLSDVFICFECSTNSATVDTAKRAKIQGKSVLAFVSNIQSTRKGVEQVIDEKIAQPVSNLDDINRKLASLYSEMR